MSIGNRVKRNEDRRLLRGEASYVADLLPSGCWHAAILRSPHAHAEIAGIDVRAACSLQGVITVLTAKDLEGRLADLPAGSFPRPDVERAIQPVIRRVSRPVLARERVVYAGQPVAVAIADSRYRAEDALDLIEVSYRPLPVIGSVARALEEDCPPLHPGLDGNLFARFTVRKGDVDQALASADGVIREKFRIQRYTGIPMETRGVLAVPERGGDRLQVWSSTQVPHVVRDAIAACLGRAQESVQVTAPEVGGGFGVKVCPYPEEVLTAYLAQSLRHPVQWIEDRREHFLATTHAREQIHETSIAFRRDGRILAVDDLFWLDNGAYNPLELSMSYNTCVHFLGPYDVAHLRSVAHCVATHKTPVAPYRGAGRPEGVFVMDRLIDRVACELGMDPADVRRINLVRPEQMPYDNGLMYKDGAPMEYDNGDYPLCLEKALEMVRYGEWRSRQQEMRQRGRYIGLGISCYVEGTGIGPYESAEVRVDSRGGVNIHTGSATHGQGHETAFAQICAAVLDVSAADVSVFNGDTNRIRYGIGTFHSRSGIVGGNAVYQACLRLKDRMLALASGELEVPEDDLEIREASVRVRGMPDRRLSFAEVARLADPARLPAGQHPGLQESFHFRPDTVTYANGVHAAVVEVDPDTGRVRVLDYAVVHDCGVMINPAIVDGQVQGGVVQGLGGALWEDLVYDEGGQLLTTSMMDYLLPQSSEVPNIRTEHVVSVSPRNPLGVKGAGEGGAIAPPPAVANAVEDALRPWSAVVREMPLTPERVRSLLEGRQSADG